MQRPPNSILRAVYAYMFGATKGDRARSKGYRLNIIAIAGTRTRFEPWRSLTVRLAVIAGKQEAVGIGAQATGKV